MIFLPVVQTVASGDMTPDDMSYDDVTPGEAK